MPSRAKVIDVEEDNGSFRVIVKAVGPGAENKQSLVARRSKFAAARHVGVLNDWIPEDLDLEETPNVSDVLEGTYFAEIETMTVLEELFLRDKVLYGIRVGKF